ncbi:MAG: hypothetical protein R2911_10180 [Caldilineaceae bacterium]
MQNAEVIFDEVRRLVAPLNAEERLALIMNIASAPSQSDAKNSDDKARAAERRSKLRAEQESWYTRTDAERAKYAGSFVALYQGQLVDYDADQRALYLRIRKRFESAPIPIIPAAQTSMPELVIRSPKLV